MLYQIASNHSQLLQVQEELTDVIGYMKASLILTALLIINPNACRSSFINVKAFGVVFFFITPVDSLVLGMATKKSLFPRINLDSTKSKNLISPILSAFIISHTTDSSSSCPVEKFCDEVSVNSRKLLPCDTSSKSLFHKVSFSSKMPF